MDTPQLIILVLGVLAVLAAVGFTLTKYKPEQVKKTIVTAAGAIATLVVAVLGVAPDLIPLEWVPYLQAFIGVCTVLGVFTAKNARHGNTWSINNPDPGINPGDGARRI